MRFGKENPKRKEVNAAAREVGQIGTKRFLVTIFYYYALITWEGVFVFFVFNVSFRKLTFNGFSRFTQGVYGK